MEQNRNYVRKKDLRALKKGNGVKVSKLQDFEGCEPNWEYSNLALNLEQTAKGIIFLESIDKKLEKLDKLDDLPQKIADAIQDSK